MLSVIGPLPSVVLESDGYKVYRARDLTDLRDISFLGG